MANPAFVLTRGDLRVEIDPDFGGRVTGFWSETERGRLDWLMPVPEQGRDVATPHKAGMFPLVPFSNRIKDARFDFAGETHVLEATEAGKPHAIHGHGYRDPWRVTSRRQSAATLQTQHDGTDWPAAYAVTQRFDLRARDLVVHLIVDNLGPGPMPVGLGWHPFFPLNGGCEIQAIFKDVWPPMKDSIPEAPRPLPGDLDFSKGLAPPPGLDTGFGGWERQAVITWRGLGRRLRLNATGPLDHVILYTPKDRDFFCLEPVSHPINAINMNTAAAPERSSVGMHVLKSGGRFGVSLSLRPIFEVL